MLKSIHGLKTKKLVHRDFKNGNILLEGKKAFLTDFDLMQHSTKERGDIMGTLHYVSAEALTGEPLDYRNDLYSWTVCLAEGIGYLDINRFNGDTWRQVLGKITNEDYLPKKSDKRLRHIPQELVSPLREVLANGLSQYRDGRSLGYITEIFNDQDISYYINLANKLPD